MRKRHLGIALVALVAAAAVPALVAAATKAYTSPKLTASKTGTRTILSATVARTDDGTARVAIYAPTGTTMTTSAAPGSVVGAVQASIAAHSLGGALIPLAGDIKVAPTGGVPAAQVTACAGTPTPTVIWLMELQAAGQTLPVPIYLVPTAGAEAALGPAKMIACFTPHDVPGTPPPCTPVLCAQFLSATLTFFGVFTPPPAGAWVALWTPYTPLTGQANAAGTVASPAVTAPGSLAVVARRRAKTVTVGGMVTQGGQPVAGAAVRLQRGRTAGRLASFRTLRTNSQGKFAITATAAAGTFFRASTTVPGRTSAAVCASLGSALPVPCVNGTISGFAATSGTVRAR